MEASFLSLPDELKIDVCRYLGPADLVTLLAVCHETRRIAADRVFRAAIIDYFSNGGCGLVEVIRHHKLLDYDPAVIIELRNPHHLELTMMVCVINVKKPEDGLASMIHHWFNLKDPEVMELGIRTVASGKEVKDVVAILKLYLQAFTLGRSGDQQEYTTNYYIHTNYNINCENHTLFLKTFLRVLDLPYQSLDAIYRNDITDVTPARVVFTLLQHRKPGPQGRIKLQAKLTQPLHPYSYAPVYQKYLDEWLR